MSLKKSNLTSEANVSVMFFRLCRRGVLSRVVWGVLVTVTAGGIATQAQTLSADDLSKLKAALSDKVLVLRNYSADDIVAFRVQEGNVVGAPVNARVFATFTPEKVQQKSAYLEITGKRKLYVQVAGTRKLTPTQLESYTAIEVELKGVRDIFEFTEKLPQELFFQSLQEAYDGLPADRKVCILKEFDEASKSIVDKSECSPVMTSHTVPPKLIHQVDPPFPDTPIPAGKYEVLLHLIVGEAGKPYDVRVIKSSRHELDTNAILAVKQYRFQPAMKDGKPTPFYLNVAVSFERF